MKKSFVLLTVLTILVSTLITACTTPATAVPDASDADAAVVEAAAATVAVEPTAAPAAVEAATVAVEPTADTAASNIGALPEGKKEITLNTGFTMRYIEYGPADGDVIIFLHGITDSSHSWDSTAPFLSDTYHTYLLDQRGHGDSEQVTIGYTIPQFGEDVIAFMDALGIEKANIVGHSMGSFIASQIASVYPERVEKLVLVGTSPTCVGNATLAGAWETVGADDFQDPISEEFVTAWQTGPNPIEEEFFKGVVAASSQPSAQVWKLAFRGLMTDDHSAFYKDITAPTLILWGELDSFFLQADQDAIKSLLPEAEFISYPNVSHNVQWEIPEQVATDIRTFLSE